MAEFIGIAGDGAGVALAGDPLIGMESILQTIGFTVVEERASILEA